MILELRYYCPAGDAAEAACLLSRRTHLSQRRITSRRENQKKIRAPTSNWAPKSNSPLPAVLRQSEPGPGDTEPCICE